ncbi:hypothetical protein J6590_094182 [Homalodisca vitripennis]|nr:hypothetical protein J6590_094182 [Homalodisca vitripennis]
MPPPPLSRILPQLGSYVCLGANFVSVSGGRSRSKAGPFHLRAELCEPARACGIKYLNDRNQTSELRESHQVVPGKNQISELRESHQVVPGKNQVAYDRNQTSELRVPYQVVSGKKQEHYLIWLSTLPDSRRASHACLLIYRLTVQRCVSLYPRACAKLRPLSRNNLKNYWGSNKHRERRCEPNKNSDERSQLSRKNSVKGPLA